MPCHLEQDISDLQAFPVVEIIDQQNRVRQDKVLEFKVIKELEIAVEHYGTTAPLHKP